MTQTGSTALTVVAWISLAVAFACAGAILWDLHVRGERQRMAVMEWVWPITALYWGPVALWAYLRHGRASARAPEGDWWPTAKGVAHCGAGCTLGDVVGEWVVYLTAFSIGAFASSAANDLLAMYAVDFVLAWTFGVAFQWFSIVPMREGVGRLEGIWLAIKADTLSIVAFQVGLFGFMALTHLVLWRPPLTIASPGYWLMMQVGMVAGFFTAWPMNAWLIRRGWKERM